MSKEQSEEKRTSILKRLKQRKEQKEIEDFKNKTELERVEERREEVLSRGESLNILCSMQNTELWH